MVKVAKKKEILFCDYFENWIETYKVGAVTDVTLSKYYMAARQLRNICPTLSMSDFDRVQYQKIINEYAKTHEKQTTTDFHHQVKGCILDAFHDGLLKRDPTYRAVIKGCPPKINKKNKFLQVDELKKLLTTLEITNEVSMDLLILLTAKTGMRFAESLAVTPNDFDFTNNTLTINKTWDHKGSSGKFQKTKNESSVRTISIDWQIVAQFKQLVADMPEDEPIFIEKISNDRYKRVFNSTYNNRLRELCEKAGVTVISMHGLRHTHASVLLAAGVSIHSISARLGHATVTVTQETYAHILDDLKAKDDQMMMSTLMSIA